MDAKIKNCDIYRNAAVSGPNDGDGDDGEGGGIFVKSGRVELDSNAFYDNNAANGGCAVDLQAAVSNSSVFTNNTFLASTLACTSNAMIKVLSAVRFQCALGTWMPPAPLSVPPDEFTGCKNSCPAGKFGNTAYLTTLACSGPCTAGHYCPQDSVSPTPCSKNTFIADTGAIGCTPCPSFSITFDTGADNIGLCQCIIGYYSDTDAKGAPVCAACPEGSTTSAVGAIGVSGCDACNAAFYYQNGSCIDCLSAFGGTADCTRPGVTIATLPVRANYWRVSPSSLAVVKCPTDGACIGAAASQAREDNATAAGRRLQSVQVIDSSSTYGDGLCRDGHIGPYCEVRPGVTAPAQKA